MATPQASHRGGTGPQRSLGGERHEGHEVPGHAELVAALPEEDPCRVIRRFAAGAIPAGRHLGVSPEEVVQSCDGRLVA